MDTSIWFGILQVTAVVVVLVLLYRPLGDYIAHVYTTPRDLRVERGLYRVIGVDSRSEQTWRAYARSVLAHFKVPTAYTFVETLPKTATGKIQKYVLRGGRAAIARQ